ncbi:2',3'-cyclic-nucleotide 3'-phosphodiesterase [Pyrenochaeta sp. MPI-SDFR-AT-0127]|nr:2',3'-cyclic-nucleotide 3'-phosphodiesterase [Pyrenochaeta sp. MPI-SDFR-AT-0127]
MPGSSLWLLPPTDHSLSTPLPLLIDKTSAHFKSQHRFLPHVTLTSDISPSSYSSEPQKWLDSLNLQLDIKVRVSFEKLESQDVFFRKLYIKCDKHDGLKRLALRSRQQVDGYGEVGKAETWVKEEYTPHLSLLYHDCPQIDSEGLSPVEGFADTIGINLNGEGDLGGWEGGRVVLVPTYRPIEEWKPIAERSL